MLEIRVGWELLHLLQLSVRSLEDAAARVVAGQNRRPDRALDAALTFEEPLPQSVAWASWVLLIASITVPGVRITPRRLSVFWEHLDFGRQLCAEALDEADEEKILTNLSDALRTHRDRLQRAIRQSVVLGLTGLGVAALGYVIDKLFFGS